MSLIKIILITLFTGTIIFIIRDVFKKRIAMKGLTISGIEHPVFFWHMMTLYFVMSVFGIIIKGVKTM